MGPVGHAPVPIDQLQIGGTAPWTGNKANRHTGPRPYQWGEDRKREIDICLNCPTLDCESGAATCPILRRGKGEAEVLNEDIREAIRAAGLRQKQVYEALHIPHSTWSLWLRRELSGEFREKILRTIAELKRPKEILDTYDLPSCRRCCNRAMCERDKLTCSARAKEQSI